MLFSPSILGKRRSQKRKTITSTAQASPIENSHLTIGRSFYFVFNYIISIFSLQYFVCLLFIAGISENRNIKKSSNKSPYTPLNTVPSKRMPLSPLSVNTLPMPNFTYDAQTHFSPNVPFSNEDDIPKYRPKRPSSRVNVVKQKKSVNSPFVGEYESSLCSR